MGGYGSFNYGESSGQSQAQSGLRGTPYQDQAAQNAASQATRLNQLGQQYQQPFTSQGTPQFMGATGQSILPGGQYGLGANTDQAMNQLAKQMFGFTSADYASRGQLSPENQAGVVGSAITNALPQLIPQLQQFQQAQTFAPYQVGQYTGGMQNQIGGTLGSLLGASSLSNQSAYNFGIAGGGGATGGR